MAFLEERVIELPKEVYAQLNDSLEADERFMEVQGGQYKVGDEVKIRGLVLYTKKLDGKFKKLLFTFRKEE